MAIFIFYFPPRRGMEFYRPASPYNRRFRLPNFSIVASGGFMLSIFKKGYFFFKKTVEYLILLCLAFHFYDGFEKQFPGGTTVSRQKKTDDTLAWQALRCVSWVMQGWFAKQQSGQACRQAEQQQAERCMAWAGSIGRQQGGNNMQTKQPRTLLRGRFHSHEKK